MRLLPIILLLSITAHAQTFTPSPGNNLTVTIGGSTYKAFCPDDYLTCDPSNLYFMAFFHGDFTSTAGTENQVMGKWIKSGGPWNGKVLLNNGDTARLCILSIPDYANQAFKYGEAVKTAIQSFSRLNTPIDGTTPIPGHFSMAGLSGGTGRIYSWQVNDTTAVRTLFKRGVIMSPVFMGASNSWTSGGNWVVWWSRNDNPLGGTPPNAAVQWYVNLLGTKDSISLGGGVCGHCNTVWDSCMTITGLDSHTGGTAATNRIRRLIDPNDGLGASNEPPVSNAGSDKQITLPTNSITQNGSSSFDPDGTITTYAWTKISGPATFTIVSPSSATTDITNLVAGTYVFRLTVTDNDSDTDTDDMTVTVSNPPVDNYIVGQLFQKTHNGDNFLVYLPDTTQSPTLKQYFVYSMVDSTGKDSAYATARGLGKKIINGWNGKQLLTDGTTACFNIIIQVNNITSKNSMENVLQWALDSLPNQCFDTATRSRNIMTAIGFGASQQAVYLLDEFASSGQSGALKFHRNFSRYTSVDHRDNGKLTSANWDLVPSLKSWWIVGGSNSYPYLQGYTKQGYDSARVYFPLDSMTKHKIISGEQYSQTTWDSSYSSLGTGAENNVFRWWADDIEFGFPGTKININEYWVADMSGADGLASKNTWYYYDSEWDIKTGNTSTVDTTDGRCYTKEAISHRRFGQRDVWVNFQKPYVLTAVYGLLRTGLSSFPDTVTFYTRGSTINNLTFLAADKRTRDDYLFRTINIGGGGVWVKIWEGYDTTQYFVMNLRRNIYTTPFTQGTDGNYQDFVFYGYELGGAAETKYNIASEAQLDDWINNTRRSTLKKHSGATFSNIYMVKDYRNLNQIRGYSAQVFTHNSKYPTNSMELQLNQDSTGYVWHNEQVLADEPDKFNYLSVNGTNQYVADTQSKVLYPPENPNYGSHNQKPTDSIGMDAAFPQNYKTLSSNLAITAATFGFNPQPNVKKRYTTGPYSPPALGAHKIYHGLEIGNEDDIDVHDSAYMTPLERAAMQWATWDGMLGTMNTGDSIEFGIKLADPSMKVLTGAFAGFNYKPATAMIVACKIIAQADTLPFDIMAGHIYHANTKRNPGVSSSITAPGAHGVPPEMMGYPADVDTMGRDLRRWINKPPSQIEITNNEWGWDKTYMRPDCVSGCDTNVFNTTLYGLPLQNAGFDSSKWHSVLLMRGTALWASNKYYASSVVFTFNDDHDPQGGGFIGPYTLSGLNGYYYRNPSTFNIDSVEYAAAAFHYRGMLKRFKNYYVENIIDQTEGGRYVMQWKSEVNSDTLMYMVWEADSLQSMVSYNIPVAGNELIKEWVASTTNIDGSEVLRTPSGGTYTASAGLEPRFFIVYTNPEGAPEPGNTRNFFRGSLRNKYINQ